RITNTGPEDVTVTKILDDKLGNLLPVAETQNGNNPIVILSTDPVDSYFEFTHSVNLSSDTLTSHTNRVDVDAIDDDQTTASAFDTETVTFEYPNPVPTISVLKTADDNSIPNTGQQVTYTFRITNTGPEDVTVTKILDDKLGNLLPVAETQNGNNPIVILSTDPVDSYFEFTHSVNLSSDTLTSHTNRVDVDAIDDDQTTASAFDTETVTFEYPNPVPTISVLKSADDNSIPNTGQLVTYTFRITNTGPEDVTVTKILDDKLGDLLTIAETKNGDNPIVIPSTDPVDSYFEFTHSVNLSSDTLTSHTNRVDVDAIDDNKITASAFDIETVTFNYPRPDRDRSPDPDPDPGRIEIFKFLDVDNSESYNDGDLPFSNILFQLFNEDDDLVGTATTNSQGNAVFTNLDEGTYFIKEVRGDYTITTPTLNADGMIEVEVVEDETTEVSIGNYREVIPPQNPPLGPPPVIEEVIEDKVPQGPPLPKTGELPPYFAYGFGSLLVLAGLFMKRKF
ncbi:MAG: hypothetical protein GT601_12055, partial [Acidaminobacter sp.]|uniref:prealbumin-like fold domain-containing protein n=2 Tax=Acidaminobacter sp. TaxID=1872102 RepID=UPI0013836B89